MKKINRKKGITLIELLLYISMSMLFLYVITNVTGFFIEGRIKNQTIAEVEQQGLVVVQFLSQSIRNAEGINSPIQGNSDDALSLDVFTPADDPTVYDLSSGVMQVSEGSSSTVDLINGRVTISDLSFDNLSKDNTPGVVRYQFIITHNNSEGRFEYNYSKTFYGSTSLR
jgi:Tfp pilus assembly protein PilW